MSSKSEITKDDAIKFIVVAVLVISFLIWQQFSTTTLGQSVLEGVKDDQFNGEVDSIFRDAGDHNAKKVRLNTRYVYSLYPDWESKVEIGDSLSKRKGSTFVEVFKENGQSDTLDYQVLAQGFRK